MNCQWIAYLFNHRYASSGPATTHIYGWTFWKNHSSSPKKTKKNETKTKAKKTETKSKNKKSKKHKRQDENGN